MKYMLDTHILIYLMKNKPPVVAERVNALGSARLTPGCMLWTLGKRLAAAAVRLGVADDLLH